MFVLPTCRYYHGATNGALSRDNVYYVLNRGVEDHYGTALCRVFIEENPINNSHINNYIDDFQSLNPGYICRVNQYGEYGLTLMFVCKQ